ncbi:MAG: hypothetical protein LBH86_02815, partial [Oscillospiraceae bacterium]|nr:hypothetical protein [Oscillospiraceae bacterium]
MRHDAEERLLAAARGRLCVVKGGADLLCRIELRPREVRIWSIDTEKTLHRIPMARMIELTKHRPADPRATWQAEKRPRSAAATLKPSLRPWENSENPVFSGFSIQIIGNRQPEYLKLQYRDESGCPAVLFFSDPEFDGIVK